MYCTNCGSKIEDGVKFCPDCGTRVEKDSVNPVTANVPYNSDSENISPKSRLAAMLLGIFLGSLGANNFYLGQIGRGIAKILAFLGSLTALIITVVNLDSSHVNDSMDELMELREGFFLLGQIMIPYLIMIGISIWSFIEWIIIAAGGAKDSEGRPVKNWQA